MLGKCVSSTFVLTCSMQICTIFPRKRMHTQCTKYRIHVQYFHRMNDHILLVEKKGMDESGNVNRVSILPPVTTSRIMPQLIYCQPIGDWQTKE